MRISDLSSDVCSSDLYTGGMSDTQLLQLLLAAVCAVIVLLVVLLLRKPGRALGAALREEQRHGRGELREQIDSVSSAQRRRIEGFGARLPELNTTTDTHEQVLPERWNERASHAATARARR